jgi:hypothetical protein
MPALFVGPIPSLTLLPITFAMQDLRPCEGERMIMLSITKGRHHLTFLSSLTRSLRRRFLSLSLVITVRERSPIAVWTASFSSGVNGYFSIKVFKVVRAWAYSIAEIV